MILKVLQNALQEAKLHLRDIDGLIAVPSLAEDYFMEAHYHATLLGLFGNQSMRCRTIDTGGAGPISALLEAERLIRNDTLECVAIVAADSVGSMTTDAFLDKADNIFWHLRRHEEERYQVQSPAIPHGYDLITQYQMENFGLTRNQLRMAVSLESFHAVHHPASLMTQKGQTFTSLEQVQQAPKVTPNISLLECARRADGAACLLVASNRFLARKGLLEPGLPILIGGGEASGPLYPPSQIDERTYASCQQAMTAAYTSAGYLTAEDIDFFGLYDCFPICLVRALEASGLCENGGSYLEEQYGRLMRCGDSNEARVELFRDKSFFPVNTHGGLLTYGAPWEVPAMYNVVEAVHQLRGVARGRQIPDCQRALVYGNGGVLSASAVAIFSKSV